MTKNCGGIPVCENILYLLIVEITPLKTTGGGSQKVRFATTGGGINLRFETLPTIILEIKR